MTSFLVNSLCCFECILILSLWKSINANATQATNPKSNKLTHNNNNNNIDLEIMKKIVACEQEYNNFKENKNEEEEEESERLQLIELVIASKIDWNNVNF